MKALVGLSILLGTVLTLAAAAPAPSTEGLRVRIRRDDGGRRVDVRIGDRPFTSYIYPASLKKPVLYPIRSAAGALVTRGFPLEPRPKERVDHPHHVGLWFNHGDVNGLDFWNNSDAITGERAATMGVISHRGIVDAAGGPGLGQLIVESDWKRPDGAVLLREHTQYVFRGTADLRWIDRITSLTALEQPVVFRDSKEGALGLRVARELEAPAVKPELYTDAAGNPSSIPVLDNAGVTGEYVSSEGVKGEGVWGTRGRWMTLGGTIGGRRVTVAMLDHPLNHGFPSYWHARGYGLFAVNPLGRKSYREHEPELTLRIEPGQQVVFAHRLLIADRPLGAEEMNREHDRFAAAYPQR